MFNHVESKIPDFLCEQINGEFRTYRINGGEKEYPSITTVLSSQDKPFLTKWKQRVGHAKAEGIRNQSAHVGSALHDMTEKYLLNESDYSRGVMPNIKELFFSYKPLIDRIDNVRALERFLYSEELEIAGTVDCIAEFDGKLSIIDFKNSRKPKKLSYIGDYLIQCNFYAAAYKELTGIQVEQIVIPIAVWGEDPQLFVQKVSQKKIDKLIKIRQDFWLTHGI